MAIYSKSSVQNFDNWRFWIRKTNSFLNLISQQDDIGKIYLYAEDISEPKYEFLIKRREDAGAKHLLFDSNAFFECFNTMDDVYQNIENMIADIMTNKEFQAIIKELFIRCRKLNIPLVFITQPYFSVPKDVSLNSTHYLIMKINNKGDLQNTLINNSANIDYEDLRKIYKECRKQPYSFLAIDTTLPAIDPLGFRKNLF